MTSPDLTPAQFTRSQLVPAQRGDFAPIRVHIWRVLSMLLALVAVVVVLVVMLLAAA